MTMANETKSVGKYLTNPGTVKAFFSGTYDEGYGQGAGNSSVFFIADTLYSYGYHFPMAIKLGFYYLINADSYSPTTGKHQSYVQRGVPANMKIEIPFSALDEAGIPYREILVVDKEESRYIEVERKVDGVKEMVRTHLMGSTLFRHKDRLFLSGIDETAKDLWNGFFLTEVEGNPTTVSEAYESMMPEEVKLAIEEGEEVLRQGEYFFVKVSYKYDLDFLSTIEKGKQADYPLRKNHPLSHKTRDANLEGTWRYHDSRHVVTNYANIAGDIFAKGTCRHKGGEHKMLKLDGWHRVYENIQKKSWTAQGRVD